ncbi:MAG: o-succinylbenzoate synthase [Lentisphaerae bacterium]|nr:o-succinylbenzoate synthase [Lentisphaerota bacterium]
MNITRATLIPYALPLARALPSQAGAGRERRGLLLSLETDRGEHDYGDVAPLPGFSHETLAVARGQAEELAARLPALNPWPDQAPAALARVAREALHPSVRFGLETALLNLIATHTRAPWHHQLDQPWRARVTVNALAAGSTAEILQAARQAVLDGFACLKIKVGQQPVPEVVALVQQLQAEFGSRLMLRLDANRAWSLDAALAVAEGIRGCSIEYLEEPLQRATDVPAFRARSGLPVALDESLSAGDRSRRARASGLLPAADVWIIKPTLRGGVAATLELATAARRAGALPVISSAFESGVGLRALFQLAALTHGADRAAGLGTGIWFERDLIGAPLLLVNGSLDVDQAIRFPTELAPGHAGEGQAS